MINDTEPPPVIVRLVIDILSPEFTLLTLVADSVTDVTFAVIAKPVMTGVAPTGMVVVELVTNDGYGAVSYTHLTLPTKA